MTTDDRHECCAYCAPPEHCDLVYVPPDYDGHAVDLSYYQLGIGRVTRVKRAAEAPPLAAIPLAKRDSMGARPTDPTTGVPWLAWYISEAEYWRRRAAEHEDEARTSRRRS